MKMEKVCENCIFFVLSGQMVAAGNIARHYGVCTNRANDVSLSVGWDTTEKLHNIKWTWDSCDHFEE